MQPLAPNVAYGITSSRWPCAHQSCRCILVESFRHSHMCVYAYWRGFFVHMEGAPQVTSSASVVPGRRAASFGVFHTRPCCKLSHVPLAHAGPGALTVVGVVCCRATASRRRVLPAALLCLTAGPCTAPTVLARLAQSCAWRACLVSAAAVVPADDDAAVYAVSS
jgi:hypothetical protein